MRNLIPLVLLFGGLVAALYFAVLAIADPATEYALQFAIASLVGVIGWAELRASGEIDESDESGGF